MDTINLREYAQQHKTPIISLATETYLKQLITELKPRYLLEVGTAIGCSTQLFAELLAIWKGQIVSFEISHPSYQIALLQQHLHHQYHMTLYRHDILQVDLSLILKYPVDFVFIDGTKAHYLEYFKHILPYCQPTTTIICDDIKQYADKVFPLIEFINSQGWQNEYISLEDGDALYMIKLATPKS